MDNLKKVLSNKFKSETAAPTAGGFEAVFSAVTQLKKKKRKRFILFYSSIAALFFIGGTWAVVNGSFSRKSKTQNNITNVENASSKQNNPSSPVVKEVDNEEINIDKLNNVNGADELLADNSKLLEENNLSNKNQNLPTPNPSKEGNSTLWNVLVNKPSRKENIFKDKTDNTKDDFTKNTNNKTVGVDNINPNENTDNAEMDDFIMVLDPTKKASKIEYTAKEIAELKKISIDNPLLKWAKKGTAPNKYYGELELVLLTGITDRKLLNPLAAQLAGHTFDLTNKQAYGYGLDLKYLYKIGKSSAVYTGLGFMKSTQKATLGNKYIEHKIEYNTRTAVVFDPGLGRNKTIIIHDTTEKTINHNTETAYTNNFTVLSIPFGYEHRIPLKNNIFVMRMGTALNIYQSNAYFSRADGNNIPVKNTEKTGVMIQGLNLGAGVLRPIGKGYYLKAELDYRNSFKLNPAMYNVGVGIRKIF